MELEQRETRADRPPDIGDLLVQLANFHVLAGEFALAVARGLADPADWPTVLAAFADDPEAARRALHPDFISTERNDS